MITGTVAEIATGSLGDYSSGDCPGFPPGSLLSGHLEKYPEP